MSSPTNRSKTDTARRKSLQARRTAAKVGMSASLGVLLWTGFNRSRRLMRYHTGAGIALMGFTVWHLMLYNGNGRKSDC